MRYILHTLVMIDGGEQLLTVTHVRQPSQVLEDNPMETFLPLRRLPPDKIARR